MATIGPLLVVVLVDLVKEFYQDMKRKQSDRIENQTVFRKLVPFDP